MIFVISKFFIPLQLCSQSVLWKYEVESDVISSPSNYWFDEDGTGYFNIKKQNPDRKNYFDLNLFLLIIDKNGKLKGSTYINDCKSNALLLPFGANKLLASGKNCNSELGLIDSKVFDYEGNIIKEGKGFEGDYFSRIKTPTGYSFFSKPIPGFRYNYLSIGHIDTSFNISNDSISINSIEKPDLGINILNDDPLLMKNKTWVVPLNYGESKKVYQVAQTHGMIIGIHEDKIIWKYPETLSNYMLAKLAGTNERIGIYMRKSKNSDDRLFVLLDQNGNELKQILFNFNFSVKDMLMTEEHIVFLNFHSIQWYDYNGNKVAEFDFIDQNFGNPKLLQKDKDGNIYFVGRQTPNSVIVKIGLENKSSPKKLIERDSIINNESSIVAYAKFDKIAKEALSVSVFPNPASININFELSKECNYKDQMLIQIFTSNGVLIKEDIIKGQSYELNVSSYSTGTYFYKILPKHKNNIDFITGRFIKTGK